MIHRFSVANYCSIREEAELDLRIPGTAPDLPSFRRSAIRPDVRLPAVAVLVGPNGSGKTTLLRALVETLRIACFPLATEQDRLKSLLPFLSEQTRDEPLRARLEFETSGPLWDQDPELFRYEIVVDRTNPQSGSSATFRHESLSHFPKGRPRRLFERQGPGTPIYVARDFGLSARDERLKAVRADAAVLPTLAMLNVTLAQRIVGWLQSFQSSTNVIFHDTWTPSTHMVADALMKDPELTKWIKMQIQCSDLGIRDLRIAGGNGGQKTVLFDHQGLDAPVHLQFESSGTKRLFHVLPQIYFALKATGLAVLDDLDGDFHVDIVGEILHWFRSPERNPHAAQLLVTSHNVGLLDDLEKEEVFIVEKDDSGATRAHGAQDIHGLRRDTRLYPKYRAGVLGGIPRIG